MAIDLRGRSSVSFYDTYAEFPLIGSDIVLYVDRDTLTMYIWNGTTYELLSGGGGASITPVANYDALPDPTTVPNEFYWCSDPQGTYWLPGSLGGTYRPSGLYYSNAVSWEYTPTPYNATQAVVDAGTNDDQFLTPSTFTNSTQLAGKVPSTRNITINGNTQDLSTDRTFNTVLIRESDYVYPYQYSGTASIGTLTSASTWTIKRIDFTTPGSPITLEAIGSWDNRTSLIYT